MTVLDVPLHRIAGQAREVHFWRMVLTALAGLLYGVGWVARRTVYGVWFACAWCAAAVKVGWQDGEVRRGPAR